MDVRKIANDLLTGKDNQTHDVARHSWFYCLVAVFVGAAWDAIHKGALDLAAFGNSIATVVGAHGAVIWAKRGAEPDPCPTVAPAVTTQPARPALPPAAPSMGAEQ